MRRAYTIGTVTVAMAFAAVHSSPAYGRAANSARNFRHYFSDLKNADDTLNPLQRFVFSLMLTNSTTGVPDSGSGRH
jgi:hypothetical protein